MATDQGIAFSRPLVAGGGRETVYKGRPPRSKGQSEVSPSGGSQRTSEHHGYSVGKSPMRSITLDINGDEWRKNKSEAHIEKGTSPLASKTTSMIDVLRRKCILLYSSLIPQVSSYVKSETLV